MNTFAQLSKYDIQGHRGCRGLMPENTIPAFLKALDLGVSTLEMDVCISQDGLVVVSHEPYINADFSTNAAGKVVEKADEKSLNLYKMNYDQIKAFDTGLRFNAKFPEQQKIATHKPLLSEVLIAAENYCKAKNLPPVAYNIEIKSDEKEYGISQPKTVAEFSDLVYAQIIKIVPAQRITLQSFDFNVLKYWKTQIENKTYQKVTISALTERKGIKKTIEELGFKPDVFSTYYVFLSKDKVAECHNLGIKVIPWTVNDIEAIKKVKEMGTDGIISDYPDRVNMALK
jgi:glycerophosphoryl diester phosphodiesterase